MHYLIPFSVFESNTHQGIKTTQQEIPYTTTVWNASTKKKESKSGRTKVLDIAGRKIILLDINGVNAPFYLSSGSGGKKNVPAGKWYPFFGISYDCWFNKGTEAEMLDYYGIPILKFYAHYLDKTVGDIRNQETPSAPGPSFTSQKEADRVGFSPQIRAINRDLQPADNETANTLNKFQANVEQWKSRLRKALGFK